MADDEKELKDQRVVTMMSPSELEAIDDWMFKNRIRSRGEAIRRLCQIGIMSNRQFERLVRVAKPLEQKYTKLQNERTSAETGASDLRARVLGSEIALSDALQSRLLTVHIAVMDLMMRSIMSPKSSAEATDLYRETERYIDKLRIEDPEDRRLSLFLRAISGDDEADAELKKLNNEFSSASEVATPDK